MQFDHFVNHWQYSLQRPTCTQSLKILENNLDSVLLQFFSAVVVRLYQLRQPITTVSDKNSWDTSTQLAVFFFHFGSSPCPPNVVYHR